MVIEKVRLEKAMTMELKQHFRTWQISGLPIEYKYIPEGANVEYTIVMPNYERSIFSVGVQFTSNKETYIYNVAEFSSLEEMQKTFPHLFELEGDLYAFP